MLAELVRHHGGVKPVEAELAPIDHVHQRIEHLSLVADLIAKAEVLFALNKAECRMLNAE